MITKLFPYRFILLFFLLSLLASAFIFSNSLQNSKTSLAWSDGISAEIQPIVDPNHTIKTYNFQATIRKLAHGIEFFALGASLAGLMYSIHSFEKKRCHIFMILFLSLAIAVSDEYIQSFTGRSSMVEDVIIDFSGAVCGIIFVSLVLILINNIQRHVTRKKDNLTEQCKNS